MADVFVSPDAVESSVCENEVEYAQERGKRIVPVLRDPVPDPQLPPEIRDRNWIPFTAQDEFEPSLERRREAAARRQRVLAGASLAVTVVSAGCWCSR